MAQKINLVQGDTLPAIDVFLTDENTGDYIGLTGATVRMYFRALGDPEILATVDGILLPGIIDANGDVNEADPYNVAGKHGHVQFQWEPGDLDQPAGTYEGEIEITHSNGNIQTVYTPIRFKLREDFA